MMTIKITFEDGTEDIVTNVKGGVLTDATNGILTEDNIEEAVDILFIMGTLVGAEIIRN